MNGGDSLGANHSYILVLIYGTYNTRLLEGVRWPALDETVHHIVKSSTE